MRLLRHNDRGKMRSQSNAKIEVQSNPDYSDSLRDRERKTTGNSRGTGLTVCLNSQTNQYVLNRET